MYEEIERVLDQHVRPLLRGHGGDMEVLGLEDGVLRFRLLGKCSGCPAAGLTTAPRWWNGCRRCVRWRWCRRPAGSCWIRPGRF